MRVSKSVDSPIIPKTQHSSISRPTTSMQLPASTDNTARIWDVSTGEQIQRLNAYEHDIPEGYSHAV